ncbi:MAG TPA: type II toxin-antitoxin system VapB family antitoxin [Candidatus Brocadiales bacterium]|nr:type II toxin-antitoxin system VapB family antitoxin [Candidatus Brocadiales bacterium]
MDQVALLSLATASITFTTGKIVFESEYKHVYHGIMKTTIDIPETDLKEALKYTGAKTKREAVVYALKDFNRRHRLAELAKILGTFKDFMTQEDLKSMREDKKWQKMK